MERVLYAKKVWWSRQRAEGGLGMGCGARDFEVLLSRARTLKGWVQGGAQWELGHSRQK